MYSGVKPTNATNNFAVDTVTKLNFINGTSNNNDTPKIVKKRVLRILTPQQLEERKRQQEYLKRFLPPDVITEEELDEILEEVDEEIEAEEKEAEAQRELEKMMKESNTYSPATTQRQSNLSSAQAANSLRKANKAIEDAYRADEDFDIFLKEVKFLKVNENYDEELISDGDDLVNIKDF